MADINYLIRMVYITLILMFSVILFAVSISIVARFSGYNDVFHAERGLAAFNIVISIYGILIGALGLFSVITQRRLLSKYVCFLLSPTIFFLYFKVIL